VGTLGGVPFTAALKRDAPDPGAAAPRTPTRTGAVGGDVRCTKGGSVRFRATANDLQLQNVTLIPLQVATSAPGQSALAPGVKPVLTTPTGLGPAGEKFTATKQRADFNKLVAQVFPSIVIVLIAARLFGVLAVKLGQPPPPFPTVLIARTRSTRDASLST
jgi:hypothetical protein